MVTTEKERAIHLAQLVVEIQQKAEIYAVEESGWKKDAAFRNLIWANFNYFNEIRLIRRAGKERRK